MTDLTFTADEQPKMSAFNERFSILNSSAFYKKKPRYQEIENPYLPAGTQEGDVIQLEYNGGQTDFYVATLNYEPELNGPGRALIVWKDAVGSVYYGTSWNASNVLRQCKNYFEGLSQDVKKLAGTTKYRVAQSGGSTVIVTAESEAFELSATELGGDYSGQKVEGTELPTADILKIAYKDGSPSDQWTRTMQTSSLALYLNVNGACVQSNISNNYKPVRPVFTLPTSPVLYKDDNGDYHSEQEYDGYISDIDGDKLLDVPGVKIATGSYVGTGKYGKSNPNTLTFDFEPKAVFIFGTKASNDAGTSMMYFWGDSSFTLIYASYSGALPSGTVSVSGNTMSWYDTSQTYYQCNQSNRTYNYIALG